MFIEFPFSGARSTPPPLSFYLLFIQGASVDRAPCYPGYQVDAKDTNTWASCGVDPKMKLLFPLPSLLLMNDQITLFFGDDPFDFSNIPLVFLCYIYLYLVARIPGHIITI